MYRKYSANKVLNGYEKNQRDGIKIILHISETLQVN